MVARNNYFLVLKQSTFIFSGNLDLFSFTKPKGYEPSLFNQHFCNIHQEPGTVASPLQMSAHLIFKGTPWNRYYIAFFYFTNEKNVVHRGYIISSLSARDSTLMNLIQCRELLKLRFSPRLSGFRAYALNHGTLWLPRKENILPTGPFLMQFPGPHAKYRKSHLDTWRSMGTRSVNIQAPCPVPLQLVAPISSSPHPAMATHRSLTVQDMSGKFQKQ